MDTKLKMLKIIFNNLNIESEYVSPNLVAEYCYNNFPNWNLSSDDIVWLSDNI